MDATATLAVEAVLLLRCEAVLEQLPAGVVESERSKGPKAQRKRHLRDCRPGASARAARGPASASSLRSGVSRPERVDPALGVLDVLEELLHMVAVTEAVAPVLLQDVPWSGSSTA